MNQQKGKKAKQRRGPRGHTPVPIQIWIVALIVVAARLGTAVVLQDDPLLLQPVLEDGTYLSEIAKIRDAGGGSDEELPRGSILYPQVVAFLPGILDGETTSLGIFQSIIEGLTALLLMLWIRRRWGNTAAWLSGTLYALDPLGGFFAARLTPVVFSTFLFVLALNTLDRDDTSWFRSPGGAAVFGACCAIGFLLSPLVFSLLVILVAYRSFNGSLFSSKSDSVSASRVRGRAWAVAALAPWIVIATLLLIRNNSLDEGGPVFSWGSGVSMALSIDKATGGTPRRLEPPSWDTEIQIRTRAWEELEREGNNYELYRYYANEAFDKAIRPVDTVETLLKKVAAGLGSWPVPDVLSATFLFERNARPLLYGSYSFALLLGLGAAGFLMTSPGLARNILLLGLTATGLACLLGPVSAASRQPALPLLCAFGGVAIAVWSGRIESATPKTKGGFGLGIGLAVSLVLGLLPPNPALKNPAEDYRLVAQNFVKVESWRQAIPILERAVQIDASNLENRSLLARAYQRDGLINAAAEQLEYAYQADSTHAGTLIGLASLEQTRGNPERAIVLMTRMVNAHPNNPLYLNELGQMLLQAGQIPTAQSLFIRALQIKPDYAVARKNLQTVEEIIQGAEQGIYGAEMKLPPDDPLNANLPVIIRAMDAGDWATADSLIALAESQRSEFVVSHWLRAGYHARRGEIDDSVRKLQLCNELDPCRETVLGLLASFLVQLGRDTEARTLLDECVDATAGDPARQSRIAAIREQLFNPTPE